MSIEFRCSPPTLGASRALGAKSGRVDSLAAEVKARRRRGVLGEVAVKEADVSPNVRFRLKAILVLTAFVAVIAGWWVDHRRLQAQVEELTALVVRSTQTAVDALRRQEESEQLLREIEQTVARRKVPPSE
jgi:hypothetical protein